MYEFNLIKMSIQIEIIIIYDNCLFFFISLNNIIDNSNSTLNLKFFWLFIITEQTKDPQVTNVVAPYLTVQNLIIVIILFSLFIFYLKTKKNNIAILKPNVLI